jgi:hypothetical protein
LIVRSDSLASRRWMRAANVIARRVADETVLVPLAARATDPQAKSARLYVLNATGEFLWSLLETPRSTVELARNLTLEFEAADDRAHSDVESFLAALRDIGAVRELADAGDE